MGTVMKKPSKKVVTKDFKELKEALETYRANKAKEKNTKSSK